MPRLEYRAIQSAAEVDIPKREVQGHLLHWENLNGHGEVFTRGAFAKSIEEDQRAGRVKFFLDHDEIVGRVIDGVEDETGLFFRAAIDPIPEGDRLLVQVASGTLDGSSVGFGAREETFDDADKEKWGRRVRRINEARWWEGSAVPWGSDTKASVQLARSIETLIESDPDHLRWLIRLGETASQELERRLAAQAEAEDPDGAKKRALAVQITETLKSQRGRLIQLTERSA